MIIREYTMSDLKQMILIFLLLRLLSNYQSIFHDQHSILLLSNAYN